MEPSSNDGKEDALPSCWSQGGLDAMIIQISDITSQDINFI